MSGFVAVVGRFAGGTAHALIDAAPHRGKAALWLDSGVTLEGVGSGGVALAGFGPGSLAVSSRYVVAADGRIDRLDARAGGGADTTAERILRAWQVWGPDAPEHLDGDFAAAVWDRERQRLWVARDAVGGRPALLARSAGRVLAGSSVPMLLADPELDRTIDERWIASFLTGEGGFARATGYQAIERLSPGSIAQPAAQAWRIRRWHRWRARPVRERTDAAYAARFRELMLDAVKRRLPSSGPIGICQSGGLDSSTVAAAARAVKLDAELVALAIPFEGRGDEQALQRSVASHTGARMRWVSLDGTDPFWDGPWAMLERYGVPPVAPNMFFIEAMADAAANEGVVVALDGVDGDGITGGNFHYLADLLVRGRWGSARSDARAIASRYGVSARHVVRRYALAPLVPAWLTVAAGRPRLPGFIDPAFAKRQRLRRRLAAQPWKPWANHRAHDARALDPGITPLVLELMDETWTARGIRIEHPFMDRALIEFCLGLPRAQKVAGPIKKVVVRAAMRGLLPPEVTERAEKADLAEPFCEGLSRSGWGHVRQGASLASSNSHLWLAQDAVERTLAVAGGEQEMFDAYRVAYLGHWLRWNEAHGRRRQAVTGNGG